MNAQTDWAAISRGPPFGCVAAFGRGGALAFFLEGSVSVVSVGSVLELRSTNSEPSARCGLLRLVIGKSSWGKSSDSTRHNSRRRVPHCIASSRTPPTNYRRCLGTCGSLFSYEIS